MINFLETFGYNVLRGSSGEGNSGGVMDGAAAAGGVMGGAAAAAAAAGGVMSADKAAQGNMASVVSHDVTDYTGTKCCPSDAKSCETGLPVCKSRTTSSVYIEKTSSSSNMNYVYIIGISIALMMLIGGIIVVGIIIFFVIQSNSSKSSSDDNDDNNNTNV